MNNTQKKSNSIFISYYINPADGQLYLEFSDADDRELLSGYLQEDILKCEKPPSCEIIEVEGEEESYCGDDARLDLSRHLWKKLGDIPTDENGVDGSIDEDYLHFAKGTPVYDIWQWFEDTFDVSVATDLMRLN